MGAERDKSTDAIPIHEENPKIGKPAKTAAGLKGVTAGLGHVNKYMRLSSAAKVLQRLNQKGGIDCPGCAWPDPDDDRSRLGEYCENGLKAIAEEASKKGIGGAFFARHSVSELAQLSDFELGKQGRILEPLILLPGESHYQPIGWDQAFKKVAQELTGLKSPHEAVFYTSGRTSNEAAFLYQLFVRQYGTNNLPDCSNMCHESSGQGLSQTLGIGKGSVTLEDLHEAEVIMVMGQNPGTNHPRMLTALEKCKKNGGKIITVNPLPETGLLSFTHPQKVSSMLTGGTSLTDLFLQIQINGDVALLKAIMLLLLKYDKEQGGIVDREFIEQKTEGFEAFKADLEQHSLEERIAETGLPRSQVEAAASLIARHKKIIICWAMGLTQHVNGVDNVREIVNLLLLRGAIGKPGAGTCPVRGHSNVQGDRTMGIWEAPKEAFLNRLEEVFDFSPPREHGFAVVDAIEAMHKGAAKVFLAMGGNFLSATPDTAVTAEALKRCQLTVHVSTKLNRSHLVHGETALILPCLGRTEVDNQTGGRQFVTVENSMGVVHSSEGVLDPCSPHLLSEPAIIGGLAEAVLGEKTTVPWTSLVGNYDEIRDLIEQVIPGFEDYNTRVRNPAGFYLPNGARSGHFTTDNGRAKFSINELPQEVLPSDHFWMMTIRSHDQYNTTIYGMDDRYRGIQGGRRVVLLNQDDMKARNWVAGQTVNLISTYDGHKREALQFKLVPFSIPRKCIATYFPEANVLVPRDLYARGSKTPASKKVAVAIVPVD